MDRSEINRALAKAIAFKQCGKHAEAELWAARLLGLLEVAEILNPNRIGLIVAARTAHEGCAVSTLRVVGGETAGGISI